MIISNLLINSPSALASAPRGRRSRLALWFINTFDGNNAVSGFPRQMAPTFRAFLTPSTPFAQRNDSATFSRDWLLSPDLSRLVPVSLQGEYWNNSPQSPLCYLCFMLSFYAFINASHKVDCFGREVTVEILRWNLFWLSIDNLSSTHAYGIVSVRYISRRFTDKRTWHYTPTSLNFLMEIVLYMSCNCTKTLLIFWKININSVCIVVVCKVVSRLNFTKLNSDFTQKATTF